MVVHWLGTRIGKGARVCGESSQDGDSDMSERFTNMLLAALNESTEFKDSEWNSIEEPVGRQSRPTEFLPSPSQTSENRFAAVVSCGMAKIRSSSEETVKALQPRLRSECRDQLVIESPT